MVRPTSGHDDVSGTAGNVAARMMLAGITATDLAKAAGVSRDTITRWLDGATSHPHRLNEILAALARLEDTRQVTSSTAPAAQVFEVAPGVEVALRPSDEATYGDVRRVSEVLARMARELRKRD